MSEPEITLEEFKKNAANAADCLGSINTFKSLRIKIAEHAKEWGAAVDSGGRIDIQSIEDKATRRQVSGAIRVLFLAEEMHRLGHYEALFELGILSAESFLFLPKAGAARNFMVNNYPKFARAGIKVTSGGAKAAAEAKAKRPPDSEILKAFSNSGRGKKSDRIDMVVSRFKSQGMDVGRRYIQNLVSSRKRGRPRG